MHKFRYLAMKLHKTRKNSDFQLFTGGGGVVTTLLVKKIRNFKITEIIHLYQNLPL